MYKIVVHGSDKCDACIRTQNKLTHSHIPFDYDDLEVSLSLDYATIPVTEVRDLNNTVVYKFTGLPSKFNISVLKGYLEYNTKLS